MTMTITPVPSRTDRTTRTTAKHTKAALAAALAVLLLLGGAGSLAYWNDTEVIDGTPLTSGELKLTTPDCGTGWLYGATGSVPLVNQLIIPGSVVRKLCTINIVATGEGLQANLGISTAAFNNSNPLATQLSPAATFLVNGASQPAITSTDNGKSISANITVTFTGATATILSQGLSTTLNNLSVTVTQVV